MKISVDLPDDTDPKAVDALEKAITDAGGTWDLGDEAEMPPEMPGMPPAMPPGQAGAIMQTQGAQGLRPPGLG